MNRKNPEGTNTFTAAVQTFTKRDLSALSEGATTSARRRTHLNVHASPDANVQRLFIATEPDTYMRPHRHPEPHKWEFLAILCGRLALLVFDDAGQVRQRIAMSPDATVAIEIAPNTFHAYVCLQAGTVALEIKEGAYIPTPEHEFAPWSPAERSPGAHAYLTWMRTAKPSVSARQS